MSDPTKPLDPLSGLAVGPVPKRRLTIGQILLCVAGLIFAMLALGTVLAPSIHHTRDLTDRIESTCAQSPFLDVREACAVREINRWYRERANRQ